MTKDEQENLVYNSPTPEEIPIIANSPYLYQEAQRSDEDYISIFKELRKCNFNTIILNPSNDFWNQIFKITAYSFIGIASIQTIEEGGYLIFKFY